MGSLQHLRLRPHPLMDEKSDIMLAVEADEPWASCYVPTEQIKPDNWDEIQSLQGVFVVGKCCNGKFYEVAVHASYLPWLQFPNLDCDPDREFDRAQPAEAEVRVYGILAARKRAQAQFLQNALRAIASGRGPGLLSYYRHIVPSPLQTPLEWAILNHDVLESDPQVRSRFAQCLVFLGLNLLRDYNCPTALELLEKDEEELLSAFRKDHMDLLQAIHAQPTVESHHIALLRSLLVFSGGGDDFRQESFHPAYTAHDNANLYGSVIGIAGSNLFGIFDSLAMQKALSVSKAFAGDDAWPLDVSNLANQMMASLPVGFPQGYLDLPVDLLYNLGRGQIDEIRQQLAQVYFTHPSLQTPENNVLVLLTWSSIVQGQPHRALSEWVASDDGWNVYQRLLMGIQGPQTIEQLALMLAALLCYKRLLPYTPNDTTHSTKGLYLADFDALICGERLDNERAMFEHMMFSFLRVLGSSGGDYRGLQQFLAAVLDTETLTQEPADRFSDRYWAGRMRNKLAHKDSLRSLNYAASRTSPQRYKRWIFVPVVVLCASVMRYVPSSVVLKILFFSTCGESLTLFMKHAPLRCSAAQQPGLWGLLAQASLCFLKILFSGVGLSVGWALVIDDDLMLSALLSISTVCTLLVLLCQIYDLKSQGLLQRSSVAGHGVQDVEKAPSADEGRQYFKKGSLAELRGDFDCESYTLVRLSDLGNCAGREISEMLDHVGQLHQVLSVLELPDESWEMVVLWSYLPELHRKIDKIFPGCTVEPDYDPTEPTREEVERLNIVARNSELKVPSDEMAPMNEEDTKRFYVAAKALKIDASSTTARKMIREAWPAAAAFYSSVLLRNAALLQGLHDSARPE